jgi:outer membrane protein assembly factor BamD (BamD/ComL family)
MRRWKRMTTLAMAAALAAGMLTAPAQAAREARSRDAGEEGAEEYQAMRLLEKAQDLHNAGDYEQAQKMLENIVDKWPNSKVRFRVWLTMGKQAMDRGHWADAITAFTRVGTILRGTEKLFDEDLEVYLESLYLTGVAQYESSQYNLAFPVLRRITVQYPNSVWANQAYYYIGMCHFAKENWSRAIENLSRVGTLVDPDSPSAEYMEAARRFYIRIDDGDLPTIYELGQEATRKSSSANP